MLEKFEAKLIGESPLLMHNGQLADPLNSYARAMKVVSSRRKKTDADHEELRKLEWIGGLYLDADGRPAIPADVLLAVTIEGAKKSKKGVEAKAGVFEVEPFYRLIYDGPKDVEQLYEAKGFADYRGVRVQRNRVMRSRPRFNSWSVSIALAYDSSIIEERDIQAALTVAGERIGLCDYRPRFGRFRVE